MADGDTYVDANGNIVSGGSSSGEKWNYDSHYIDGGYWTSADQPGLRWSSTLQNWVTQAAPQDLAPSTATGGGGSTSPTNVYITQNPGELYQTVVSDGTDGYAAGTVYQVNKLTGAVTVKSRPTTTATATNFNDVNGDGYDDQTGLPNGAAYVGGKLYYHGIEINPDGSPKTGGGKQTILIDRDGSVTGRAGTSYYYDETGTPHTLVTGSAPSTSSGGGSSSGGSSGGGSAGGGLSGVHSGGYNNTNTSIHEGGYTNTNISEIGPLEAAMRASEFAANNALAKNKQQQELAALYSQQLRDVDPNAYQVFLEKMGGGRLDNALLSGGNALSQNALRGAATSLGALNGLNMPNQAGGGLGMTTGGGGLQLEGGGPASPGGGLPGTPAQPAATPVANGNGGMGVPYGADGNTSWATGLTGEQQAAMINASRARTNVSDAYGKNLGAGVMVQGDYGGNPVDLTPYYRTLNGILSGRTPGTQTVNPYGAGYRVPVDPRIAAQATDDRQRDISGALDPRLFNPDGSSKGIDPKVYGYPADTTAVPLPYKQVIPAMAGGGLTRAPQFITGDPQRDGRPNPEMIVNPTNAPISVMPMRGMMRAGGGLPRYAYGTNDPYDQIVADKQTLYDWQAPQGQTAVQPTQQPAQQTQTTQPENNPAQIGTYSTAPGSAGQPVAQPTPQPVTQPATTPLVSLVSGASGGSAQPSQSAFDEVMYTRLAATNPWMSDPTSYMNVDYLTRDPIARRNYEQWLTLKYGVPQESIAFAQARNRLGGASLASMSQGR